MLAGIIIQIDSP